jgi:4-hydroxybenzoate polyprenyltransferase/phosphoserine phosphatase
MSANMENPLVVDLDGTLIKTDLLIEAASKFIITYPLRVLRLLWWLLKGKLTLKSNLARFYKMDPSTLPYNTELIAWLKEQKKIGREIILATASHKIVAEKVAGYLELFSEVIATDEEVNVKSKRKRDALVVRFGERGFDYVGDSKSDLPVWESANNSYVVSGSNSLIKKAKQNSNVEGVFQSRHAFITLDLIKELRPHQWLKNILVFIPLIASHLYGDEQCLINSVLGFIAFCFVASSVYIINDIVDISVDREHERKKHRPMASGNMPLLHGWVVWPILVCIGFSIAFFAVSFEFFLVLAGYYLITLLYSFLLKKISVVDVLALACLYTLRIFAGAVAISVYVSSWLLTFSCFFFLSLAFIKRLSEIKSLRNNNKTPGIPGRGYITEDFEMVLSMGTGAGYISVLVLALYINDKFVINMYTFPQILWLSCILLLFWILRVWSIACRGEMHEDPVVFSITDKLSWIVGLSFVLVFIAAKTF